MNTIHPTAIVGDGVQLGRDNVIGPYAVVVGPVRLGDRNWIGPHVVIGTPGEIRGIDHGADPVVAGVGAGVLIGSGNVVREHATIHQGHYALTRVGDDCYLMNRAYVAHDCVLGDGVTMAAGVSLGGHVHVGRGATVGMGAIVHQRRVIGPGAMIGMGTVVTRDVPPYALVHGNPGRIRGANAAALRRAGAEHDTIDAVDVALSAGVEPTGATIDFDPAAWAWWAAETAEDLG